MPAEELITNFSPKLWDWSHFGEKRNQEGRANKGLRVVTVS
jgi:hypothetical protein